MFQKHLYVILFVYVSYCDGVMYRSEETQSLMHTIQCIYYSPIHSASGQHGEAMCVKECSSREECLHWQYYNEICQMCITNTVNKNLIKSANPSNLGNSEPVYEKLVTSNPGFLRNKATGILVYDVQKKRGDTMTFCELSGRKLPTLNTSQSLSEISSFLERSSSKCTGL